MGAHDDPGLEDANGRKLVLDGKGLAPVLDGIFGIGRDPVVGDVVPVEEAADVGTGRVPLCAEHDRPARRPVDGEPGQPSRALDPVDRKAAHLCRHVRSHRGDSVVVARVEPHHTGCLCGAKPDREDCAERDRHLPEHLAGRTLPDRALDPVDDLDGLDAPLDEPEERLLAALVRRVLPDGERDVRRRPREPRALVRIEPREDRDPRDLVRGHHARAPVVG